MNRLKGKGLQFKTLRAQPNFKKLLLKQAISAKAFAFSKDGKDFGPSELAQRLKAIISGALQ